MTSATDYLRKAFSLLGSKPGDDAKAHVKKAYSEDMSAGAACALSQALRDRGLQEVRPTEPGELDASGAERRMSGGIGAKKVDVTWATEESGLLLAISIKTINFRDNKTGNFQKNLTNRRGDMLFEAVTLHRRFPYAVLGGFFFFDKEAADDETDRRNSTFLNAHDRFKIFTGRDDPHGRDEQYEHLFIGLVDASPFRSSIRLFEAGKPHNEVDLDAAVESFLRTAADRNPDFYRFADGTLRRI